MQAILHAIERAGRSHRAGGGSPTVDEMSRIHAYLEKSIGDSAGNKPQPYWMTRAVLHEVGARVDQQVLATGLLELLATVEMVLPDLRNCRHGIQAFDKKVGDRRVRVAGQGDDSHSGDYLLLIDAGGSDQYVNVGPEPAYAVGSVVIDLDGDDAVQWVGVPGPGAGVLDTCGLFLCRVRHAHGERHDRRSSEGTGCGWGRSSQAAGFMILPMNRIAPVSRCRMSTMKGRLAWK